MDINKNKLIELCDQIKAKLIEKGKTRFIINVASTNEELNDVELDDDAYEEFTDYYSEDIWNGEPRLVAFDCGGYYRALQMDGVVIENDTLYFYLTETELDDGIKEIDTQKKDINGLLNEKAWWMQGHPYEEFNPEGVLGYFLNSVSDDECEFLI